MAIEINDLNIKENSLQNIISPHAACSNLGQMQTTSGLNCTKSLLLRPSGDVQILMC